MTSEDFFKRIVQQYDSNLPFVVYRKPNKTKVAALLQNNITLCTTDDLTESGFVFSPFNDKEKTVLIPLKDSEHIYIHYDVMSGAVETSQPTGSQKLSDKQQHISLVKKGVEAINHGVFKKVVLSRKEEVNVSESNPISIFKNLLQHYTSAFVYCWYHPKIGLWLGATPETLVKIEGSRFSMMALAGTQNYNGTIDVVWQDKEKQEQQFVTDFIIEKLEPSVDEIKVSSTDTVKAGNLLHLKTMITASLKKESKLKNVIAALHPTPAVCGLPKGAAKAFILENENYDREFYTGFLGELNIETHKAPRSGRRNIENRAYAITRKSTQLYVNLRCMQLQNNKGIIYVGGGVTKTSNPESEWEETVSKSLVIKKVL